MSEELAILPSASLLRKLPKLTTLDLGRGGSVCHVEVAIEVAEAL